MYLPGSSVMPGSRVAVVNSTVVPAGSVCAAADAVVTISAARHRAANCVVRELMRMASFISLPIEGRLQDVCLIETQRERLVFQVRVNELRRFWRMREPEPGRQRGQYRGREPHVTEGQHHLHQR